MKFMIALSRSLFELLGFLFVRLWDRKENKVSRENLGEILWESWWIIFPYLDVCYHFESIVSVDRLAQKKLLSKFSIVACYQ